MKIYLAGKYEQKQKLLDYATELNRHNVYVTSKWLYDQLDTFASNALRDLDDIDRCDTLVHILTNEPSSGRHFETGYAFAKNKMIVTIGYRNGIFYFLPGMMHYDTWQEYLNKGLEK